MTAIILYSQTDPNRITRAHKRHITPAGTVWVRCSCLPNQKDLSDALDKARPQPGEVVLNTIAAPEQPPVNG